MADQKLSGLDEVSSLGPNDLVYVSDGGSKRITKYNLEGTIKPDEAVLADNSLQLGGVDADQYVQADGTNNNFISTSSGSGDAGKPISLNAQGKVDESMIGIGGGFTYIGSWTPTSGTEYPDTTGIDTGSFWTVDGLTADYTFTSGDLDGQTATNNDIMIWGDNGWVLTESQLDPSAYLPLTGGELSGNLWMRTDATGKRFIGFLRNDGTFRGAIGNADTTEEFEVALANTVGDTFISNIKLVPDGNVRADFADPSDDADLVTKAYGDANYLGGSGGGDFYADGHVPMTGDLQLDGEVTAGQNGITMLRGSDSTLKAGIGTTPAEDWLWMTLSDSAGTNLNRLILMENKLALYNSEPTEDGDVITKGYGDTHYGGGGGSYLPITGGKMEGNIEMNADVDGKRYIFWSRDDDTFKTAIGCTDTTEEFELALANTAGDTFISNIKMIPDGNVRAEHANPAHDDDIVTKGYGDTHYLSGTGGGDFYADGHVPMSGGMTFDAGDDNWINFYDVDRTENRAVIDAATAADQMYIVLYPVAGSGKPGCMLTLDPNGNLSSSTQQPSIDQDFITKGYGDLHYGGGGGGGDFFADGSVPMTGIFQMNAPATGVMFSRILRDDGTLKLAYGSRDSSNQFELLLVNAAGDVEVNKLILKENGNIAAGFASPAADEDLVTKAYGDANYLGGAGGGDFYADGHVPMTGDLLMDADAGGSRAIQIRRDDGTLKCALGSWSDSEELELLLADVAGTSEVARLLLRADGNVAAPDATPTAADDLVTRAYGDANYGGGGSGYLPLTGGDLTGQTTIVAGAAADEYVFKIDNSGAAGNALSLRHINDPNGVLTFRNQTADEIFFRMGTSSNAGNIFMLELVQDNATSPNARLTFTTEGVLTNDTFPAAPFDFVTDDTLVTKAYCDATYSGGGGGDFMADGSVPMTGSMVMEAPSDDKIFTEIHRTDGTLKAAYGSRSVLEELELALYDTGLGNVVSSIIIKEDGNAYLPYSNPQTNADIVTKEYVDNALGSEIVYDMGATTVISAENGTMLIKTPSGTETMTENLSIGESVTLIVKDADASNNLTISGVTWIGDAITAWTGRDVFILWNDGSETYISYSGGTA